MVKRPVIEPGLREVLGSLASPEEHRGERRPCLWEAPQIVTPRRDGELPGRRSGTSPNKEGP